MLQSNEKISELKHWFNKLWNDPTHGEHLIYALAYFFTASLHLLDAESSGVELLWFVVVWMNERQSVISRILGSHAH
jgi:hypothetical protein